jgi:hypothetical protein
VCDSQLLFLDAETGYAGSVGDSRVFRNSALAPRLEGPWMLPPDLHLIGDSAYPLKDYLLVPYKDNGHLTPVDVRYNKRHASTRSAVERSIGLLKGKFRRLFYLDVNDYRGVTYLIYACVVLHNFILLKNGIHEEDIVLDPRRRRTPDCTDGQRLTAVQKRQRIAQSLN